VDRSTLLGSAVIVKISFRRTVVGLLKDHAMAVVYVLTTRSTVRNPYTTFLDSSSVGHHAGFMSHPYG
jgi:hypothetical protein